MGGEYFDFTKVIHFLLLFANLRWESGESEPSEPPYGKLNGSEVDADALYREEFGRAVEVSVEREGLEE